MAPTAALGAVTGLSSPGSLFPLSANGPRSSHSRSINASGFAHSNEQPSTISLLHHSTHSALRTQAFASAARSSHCGFLTGSGSEGFSLRTVLKKEKQRHGGRMKVSRGARADFYQTLGVSKSASKAEIKSAYRKLARQVRMFAKHTCSAKSFVHLFFFGCTDYSTSATA